MAEKLLDQIERLVDQLPPLEQVRLLEYLTPRIARAVAHQVSPDSMRDYEAAWHEFFRIGEALAASDTPESETLTTTVLTMRR